MESSYFQQEIWKHVNMCTQIQFVRNVLRNSLVNKNSWVAEKLGFWLNDLNEVQIAVVLQTVSIFTLIFSMVVEDIYQIAINFDVVFTIRNSFSRGKNLHIII